MHGPVSGDGRRHPGERFLPDPQTCVVGGVVHHEDAKRCGVHGYPPWCGSRLPVRKARLATTAVSSAGSTGLATWVWKPARSERFRSSGRAKAVRAAAGMSLVAGSALTRWM